MAARILVMDDDESIVELYHLLLEEEAGYEVASSLVAIEEVTAIAELQPDLIVLDAHLGARNQGLHLFEQLKQYHPTRRIPVLLCSAAQDIVRPFEETIRERGDALLYKPFDIDELLQLVERLVSATGTASRKSQADAAAT